MLYGKVVVIKRNGTDGLTFPLISTSCLIGRSTKCCIRIQLPAVSPEHCKLKVEQSGKVVLTNLSKENPTTINGKSILKMAKLEHNDIFTVVERSFRFEFAEDAKACSPSKAKNSQLSSLEPAEVRSTILIPKAKPPFPLALSETQDSESITSKQSLNSGVANSRAGIGSNKKRSRRADGKFSSFISEMDGQAHKISWSCAKSTKKECITRSKSLSPTTWKEERVSLSASGRLSFQKSKRKSGFSFLPEVNNNSFLLRSPTHNSHLPSEANSQQTKSPSLAPSPTKRDELIVVTTQQKKKSLAVDKTKLPGAAFSFTQSTRSSNQKFVAKTPQDGKSSFFSSLTTNEESVGVTTEDRKSLSFSPSPARKSPTSVAKTTEDRKSFLSPSPARKSRRSVAKTPEDRESSLSSSPSRRSRRSVAKTPEDRKSSLSPSPARKSQRSMAKTPEDRESSLSSSPSRRSRRSVAKTPEDRKSSLSPSAAEKSQASVAKTPEDRKSSLSPSAAEKSQASVAKTPEDRKSSLSPSPARKSRRSVAKTPEDRKSSLSPSAAEKSQASVAKTPEDRKSSLSPSAAEKSQASVAKTPEDRKSSLSPSAAEKSQASVAKTPEDRKSSLSPSAAEKSQASVAKTPEDRKSSLSPSPVRKSQRSVAKTPEDRKSSLSPSAAEKSQASVAKTPEDRKSSLSPSPARKSQRSVAKTPEDGKSSLSPSAAEKSRRSVAKTPEDGKSSLSPSPARKSQASSGMVSPDKKSITSKASSPEDEKFFSLSPLTGGQLSANHVQLRCSLTPQKYKSLSSPTTTLLSPSPTVRKGHSISPRVSKRTLSTRSMSIFGTVRNAHKISSSTKCLPSQTPQKVKGLRSFSVTEGGSGSCIGMKRKIAEIHQSSAKQKRVSFGPQLSPEQFDKNLPPSTPIHRGATPYKKTKKLKSMSESESPLITCPVVSKAKVSQMSPEAEKDQFQTLSCRTARREALGTQASSFSVVKTKKASAKEKSKRLISLEDNTSVKKCSTPQVAKQSLSPRLSWVRRLLKTPKMNQSLELGGIEQLLETPKQCREVEIEKMSPSLSASKAERPARYSEAGKSKILRTPRGLPAKQKKITNSVKKIVAPVSEKKALILRTIHSRRAGTVRRAFGERSKPTWSQIVQQNHRKIPTGRTVSRSKWKTVLKRNIQQKSAKKMRCSTPKRRALAAAPSTGHANSPETFVVGWKAKTPRLNLQKSRSSSEISRKLTSPKLKKLHTSSMSQLSFNKLYDDLPDMSPGPSEMFVSPLRSVTKQTMSGGQKTPESPQLDGIKGLFIIPKQSCEEKELELSGIHELFRSPKQQSEPSLIKAKELVHVQKETDAEEDFTGLKELMVTPPLHVIVNTVPAKKRSYNRKTPSGISLKLMAAGDAEASLVERNGMESISNAPQKVLISNSLTATSDGRKIAKVVPILKQKATEKNLNEVSDVISKKDGVQCIPVINKEKNQPTRCERRAITFCLDSSKTLGKRRAAENTLQGTTAKCKKLQAYVGDKKSLSSTPQKENMDAAEPYIDICGREMRKRKLQQAGSKVGRLQTKMGKCVSKQKTQQKKVETPAKLTPKRRGPPKKVQKSIKFAAKTPEKITPKRSRRKVEIIEVAAKTQEKITPKRRGQKKVESIEVAAKTQEKITPKRRGQKKVESVEVHAKTQEKITPKRRGQKKVESIEVAAKTQEKITPKRRGQKKVESIEVAAKTQEKITPKRRGQKKVESIEVAAKTQEKITPKRSRRKVEIIEVAAKTQEKITPKRSRRQVEIIEVAAKTPEKITPKRRSQRKVEIIEVAAKTPEKMTPKRRGPQKKVQRVKFAVKSPEKISPKRRGRQNKVESVGIAVEALRKLIPKQMVLRKKVKSKTVSLEEFKLPTLKQYCGEKSSQQEGTVSEPKSLTDKQSKILKLPRRKKSVGNAAKGKTEKSISPVKRLTRSKTAKV